MEIASNNSSSVYNHQYDEEICKIMTKVKDAPPKKFEEKNIKFSLAFFGIFAIFALLVIIFFLVRQSSGFLVNHTLSELIFGSFWRPSGAEGSPSYGASSMIFATVGVTALSMIFALPFGIGGAIFISEIAPHKLKIILKAAVEILSGIPSIVYGYFGMQVLNGFIADLFGVNSGSTWLTASILLAVMAQPTIISVAEDAISSVPQEYKEASLGCGATKWQTISKVIVPSASSGIAAAVILGTGRVIGETMAVMMVAGGASEIPDPWYDVLSPVRTITHNLGAQMAEAVGDSNWLNALWMLGVILMLFTIVINMISRQIMRKMNEKFNPRSKKDICSTIGEPTNKWEEFCLKVEKIIRPIQINWENWKKEHQLSRQTKQKMKTELKIVLAIGVCALFIEIIGIIYTLAIIAAVIGIYVILKRIEPKFQQIVAFIVLTFIIFVVIFCLGVIIFEIFKLGLPVMSWEFLTTEMENNASAGGIVGQIVGTLWLTLYTMVIALPFGIGAGIFLAEYTNSETFISKTIHAAIDLLNGLPSIIYGMFGYLFFRVLLGMGTSLISGALILSLMILPTLIRTTEEAIIAVPKGLREASYATGATKWQTIKHVVLPSSKPSIITGVVLSIGRVVGETAPIMFIAAAFEINFYPLANPLLAVQTLSYHLYGVWSEYPEALPYAGGTALTLLLMVLIIFSIANIMRYKYQKQLKK